MKKRLYIVRHGETEYNKRNLIQGRQIDAPLNDLGNQQAKNLAEWFRDVELSEVICSNMIRTYQTAEPIFEAKNIECSCHTELDELDYGDFEGESIMPDNQAYHEMRQDWIDGNITRRAPNGESPFDVLNRADKKCRELIQDSQNHHILIMIHGRLMRILLSHWLGYGLERMQEIRHANTAINILEYQQDNFSAVKLHITDHLKP